MTDQELVSLTLKSPNQYQGLVERYEAKITRYVKRFLFVSTEDTEDIVQETFINAYKYLNSYKKNLSFSTWIYRIAHNQCVTYLRRHSTRISLEQAIPQTEDEERDTDEQFVSDTDIEHEVMQLLRQEDVINKLKELDSMSREVLVLRYLEEKEYIQIAEILRVSDGTVASLIHRAKHKLKKIVKNEQVK